MPDRAIHDRSSEVSSAPPTMTAGRGSRTRYLVLALILVISTIAYADRSVLSITGTSMEHEFHLNAVQLGYIFSAFSWAYVIGQLPGGLLLDRFGTKKIYGLSMALWALTTILISLTGALSVGTMSIVVVLFTLRFLLGLAESPGFPANARVTAMWFPAHERGTSSAVFTSSQYLAVAIFSPLAAWISGSVGWQWAFVVLGGLCAALAVVWFRWMDSPRRHPRVTAAELKVIVDGGGLVDVDGAGASVRPPRPTKRQVLSLLTNRMLWAAYIGQFCTIALSYFFITWFPIYLVEGRGMNILQAGFASVIPAVLGFAGGASGGVLSDLLVHWGWSVSWARKTPFVVGMVVAAGLALCSFLDNNIAIIAMMSVALFGKGVAAGAGTWTVISDCAPVEATGLAGGIFNGIGNVAGITTPIVVGYIVAATGSFNVALWFVAAHCAVAALAYLVLMGKIKRITLRK